MVTGFGVILACALLVSCGGSEVVTVDASRGAASVPQGHTLAVRLGEAGASTGQWWFLTEDPNSQVLKVGESHVSGCGEDGESAPGCTGKLVWEFAAIAPGRTSVQFQYCFRSEPPNCQSGEYGPAEPIQLKVTVTPE